MDTTAKKLHGRKSNSEYVKKIVGLGLLTAVVIVLQLLGSTIKFGTFSISLVLMPIVVGAALYGVWAGAWLGFVFGVVVLLAGDAAPFMAVNPFGTIVTVLLKGALAGALSGLVYKLFANKSSTGKLAMIISSVLMIVGGGAMLYYGISRSRIPVERAIDESVKAAVKSSTFSIVFGSVVIALGIILLIIALVNRAKINVSTAVFASAVTCPIVNTGIFLLGCLLFFMPTIRAWAGDTPVGTFMIVVLVGFNFLFELAVNLILSPAIVMLIRLGESTLSKKKVA